MALKDTMLKDILFTPLYLYQGKKLKRTALRLPEADGERHGSVLLPVVPSNTYDSKMPSSTSDSTLGLKIIGDSSAAGVGVTLQQDALTGRLIYTLKTMPELQAKFECIEWSLHATTGHTSANILRRLYVMSTPIDPIDIIIIVAGVNDATSNVTPDRWEKQLKEIITISLRKFGAKHIVFSCLPPMADMPAMPAPLSHFLGAKVQVLEERLIQTCKNYNNVTVLDVDFAKAGFMADDLFASDGIHPSAAAYEFWANELAVHIKNLVTN